MKEENLIFLISQPRSGSTLLQRILGSHSEIYTRSEPWIMFPFAYSLKSSGIWAEYDYHASTIAIEDFIVNLQEGKKQYLKTINHACLSLYGDYTSRSKKQFFLDKTPRYYMIFEEILAIFPNAKFILLIRNPLAVLSSMLETWVKRDYMVLNNLKYDLLFAVDNILRIKNDYSSNVNLIYYEELLNNTDSSLGNLFDYLGLSYETNVLNYFENTDKMLYGDPENVYKYKGIKQQNDTKWLHTLRDKEYWSFFKEYIEFIGEKKFQELGYDFEEMMHIIKANEPTDKKEISLFDYIDNTDYFKNSELEYLRKLKS